LKTLGQCINSRLLHTNHSVLLRGSGIPPGALLERRDQPITLRKLGFIIIPKFMHLDCMCPIDLIDFIQKARILGAQTIRLGD
jgi:hypothetical protein